MPPRNSPDARVYRGVLVGLGGIARSGHLPAFQADPTVASRLKIVGIVDDAPNAPSTFDGIPLLSRPDRLSDLGPVDFVDICTPTSSHLAEFRVYRLGADPGASADSVPWRGRRAAGRGGVLLDHGTHLVYELLDVAGPPQAVRAWTGRLRHGA